MPKLDNKKLNVDFFIAGAAKCGTSSLAEYLSQHSQICFAYPKEPAYFADENFEPKYAFTREEYAKCFKRNTEHKVTGEGSVLYIYSDTAVKNILEFNPQAKFIVMLRNPIDQVYSFFLQLRHCGYESEEDFTAAWNREAFDKRSIRNLKQVASTGTQLQRLLSMVQRDKVLLITLEDMIRNPREVYLNVLDFIGVEDDGKTEFEVVNQAGEHRNAFMKFIFMLITNNRFLYKLANNTIRFLGISAKTVSRIHKGKNINKVPLSMEMRRTMAADLKDQVEILSGILGRDLSEDWLDFKPVNLDNSNGS